MNLKPTYKSCFFLTFFVSLFGNAQTLTIGIGAEITVLGDINGVYTTILDCDGTIIIEGSVPTLTKYATLNLDENATVKCGGDFIKDGTRATFGIGNIGLSTLIMDGTAPSQISGGTTGSATSFSLYNLVINNLAGVTINTSHLGTLTVRNIVTRQSGTFSTNNALILNASSATNYARVSYGSGVVSGDVLVEKRLSNNSASWRHFSMPIASTLAAANWNGITLLKNDHSPSNQVNTFVYNAAPSGVSDYAFGQQQAAPTGNQTDAYMIYSDQADGLHLLPSTSISVKGPLNQGDFLNTLEFTRDTADNPATNDDAKGWNFIPNPWAALININALLTDATNFTPAYKAVHVWDVFSQGYSAILGNGVTKINYGAAGSNYVAATSNLAPFQAFWVKADAPNQVCNLIESTMRTTNYADNVVFMKTAPETIRLNIFDRDSLRDQLVIYVDEAASRSFDLAGDAYYFSSQNKQVPVFYAREGESRASIVARPLAITDSVIVTFGSPKEQSKFYIHADLDELQEGWFVYLRDKKDNKTYALQHNKSIAFSHVYGLASQRFVVYYSKNQQAFNHLITGEESNIVFFVNNGTLNLQAIGTSGSGQINLYDAVGRLLHTEKKQFSLGERLEVDFTTNQQFIIVEVILNGNAYREKVYF